MRVFLNIDSINPVLNANDILYLKEWLEISDYDWRDAIGRIPAGKTLKRTLDGMHIFKRNGHGVRA